MQTSGKTGIRSLDLLASKPAAQVLAILLFALLLTSPGVWRGISSGYDSTTHARYQHHFSQQFWDGDLYPRWLVQQNKGHGSPIFLIQYPLPYFVTAMLRPFLPFPDAPEREARELGIFIFIALASAGLAARHWFGKFSGPLAATFAAVAYMSLPYFMVDIYLRAAIGELSALVWMPLLLAFSESMHKNTTAVFLLGAAFALLIVSNAIVALLFIPVLIVYALSTGQQLGISPRRSAFRLSLASMLGLGMAGAYLVPVIAYRGLFNLRGLVDNLPDFEMGRYFLYLASSTLDRRFLMAAAVAICLALAAGWRLMASRANWATRMIMAAALVLGLLTLIPDLGQRVIMRSNVAVTSFEPFADFLAIMLLTLSSTMFLGLIAYCHLPVARDRRESTLLLVACLAFILMLPFAAPLWKAIPALSTIQFPFRLGAVLTVAVAGLIASSLDRHFQQGQAGQTRTPLLLFGMAVLWVIGAGMLTCRVDDNVRSPRRTVHYQQTQDLDLMYRTYVAPPHLQAFAKSIGTKPSSYFAAPAPGDGSFRAEVVAGEGAVDVVRLNARCFLISADCSDGALLNISQLYFPLWKKVPLNGTSDDTNVGVSPEGLVQLSLVPGKQQFQLVFDGGSFERWGLWTTAVSLLVSLIGYVCSALISLVKCP